jgi:hypothetical protein
MAVGRAFAASGVIRPLAIRSRTTQPTSFENGQGGTKKHISGAQLDLDR